MVSKNYQAYLEFRKAIEKGKSVIYFARDYVVLPIKKYKELVAKKKPIYFDETSEYSQEEFERIKKLYWRTK